MGNEGICTSDNNQFRKSVDINLESQTPIVRGNFDFTSQQTFKKIQKAALNFCQQRQLDNHYIPTVARMIAYRHDNLFDAYRRLPQQHRQSFMDDISYLDIQFMDSLYFNLITNQIDVSLLKSYPNKPPMLNFSQLSIQEIKKLNKYGIRLTQQSRVGIVFMCGGSSSRFLGSDKFLCPLQVPQKQCIFELMFQKLKNNISVKCKLAIPIIIICNQDNRIKIQKFLKNKSYFGFDISKFRFLMTKNLPILNQNGKFCQSFQYKILNKPSGTGQCVQAVLNENTYNFLKNQQVKYIHFCGMENLAENPCDPILIGLMQSQKKSVCAKCTLPNFQTQLFHRYVYDNDKIHLIDVEALSSYNQSKLLKQSPIAMNSIIFELDQLKQTVSDFNNKMFLSKKYHVSEELTDYFDFFNDKPALKQKCYTFQKNISDLLTCFQKPLLILYPRSQFIPLVSKDDEYSIKSSSFKYMELLNQSNTSQQNN